MFTGDPTCRDVLWILGDNFTAKSYRSHFKSRNANHYIKKNYEVTAFCNSKFASSNTNMLSRLQNTLATGLNKTKNGILPKYILVILDDDLITYLDYKREGVATLLGKWIEWLVKEFNSLIGDRKKQLPQHCRKIEPFFYWVSAPTHDNFSKERNNLHMKFNLSLDSVIGLQSNMRVVRMKDPWNPKDGDLVMLDKITETGMSTYWDVVDSTFCFNETRCEQFVAKNFNKSADLPTSRGMKQLPSTSQSTVPMVQGIDPMIGFLTGAIMQGIIWMPVKTIIIMKTGMLSFEEILKKIGDSMIEDIDTENGILRTTVSCYLDRKTFGIKPFCIHIFVHAH